MRMAPKFWRKKYHPLSILLQPLALGFKCVSKLRQKLYGCKIFPVHELGVPVIIVGNLGVGGNGKTPVIIALANLLKQRGYKPGIISRGYGREVVSADPILVTPQSHAQQVGDEPVLIYRHTFMPLAVGPNKFIAAKLLVEQENCDLILSDDGMQHYALARDLEIAVVNYPRGVGNQQVLPAGPLREPLTRLDKVNWILLKDQEIPGKFIDKQFKLEWKINCLRQINNPATCENPRKYKNHLIHAVTGIGDPESFFQMLEELGYKVVRHVYPNHHMFQKNDFAQFSATDIVIMTEKDAVKCGDLVNDNYWFAELACVLPANFSRELIAKLREVKKNVG